MRTKRLWIILLAILLVGGLAIYLLWPDGSTEEEAVKPTITQTAAPADVRTLEKLFNSQDIATQSKALAPGLSEAYKHQGQNPLVGMTLQFDYASYRPVRNGVATINAILSNGAHYQVKLVKQDGHWYIWDTEKR